MKDLKKLAKEISQDGVKDIGKFLAYMVPNLIRCKLEYQVWWLSKDDRASIYSLKIKDLFDLLEVNLRWSEEDDNCIREKAEKLLADYGKEISEEIFEAAAKEVFEQIKTVSELPDEDGEK